MPCKKRHQRVASDSLPTTACYNAASVRQASRFGATCGFRDVGNFKKLEGRPLLAMRSMDGEFTRNVFGTIKEWWGRQLSHRRKRNRPVWGSRKSVKAIGKFWRLMPFPAGGPLRQQGRQQVTRNSAQQIRLRPTLRGVVKSAFGPPKGPPRLRNRHRGIDWHQVEKQRGRHPAACSAAGN